MLSRITKLNFAAEKHQAYGQGTNIVLFLFDKSYYGAMSSK